MIYTESRTWDLNPVLLTKGLINCEDYTTTYPDKLATFTRDSPLLTQFDGIGMMELEEQEKREFVERRNEDMIMQIAGATGRSAQTLRTMNKIDLMQRLVL